MDQAPDVRSPDWWTTPYEDLRVERRDGGVAVLTLDRPERRNLMTAAMTASWERAISGLAGDRHLRCVVVTGAGAAFSSGGDTGWIASLPGATVDEQRTRMLPFYRAWLSIRTLEVPVVAAVNGAAIGAGLALALACDLRFVAEDARLGAPFTALGLHPGMGTTWLLPAVAGLAVATDLLLTGRLVNGTEAVELGLASRALPTADVLPAALAAAESIAATAPVATRLTTAALRAGGPASLADALQWEALAQPVTLATADLYEGVAAAREKRPARFAGR